MPAPTNRIISLRPKPPLRFFCFFGASRSALPASRRASAAALRSLCSFLSSMIAFVGVLPFVRRSYALLADSKATRTLSRSSSSLTIRCTYGLSLAAATASAAVAALFLAMLYLTRLRALAILYPRRLLRSRLCEVHPTESEHRVATWRAQIVDRRVELRADR